MTRIFAPAVFGLCAAIATHSAGGGGLASTIALAVGAVVGIAFPAHTRRRVTDA
jgi:hypothetical protein